MATEIPAFMNIGDGLPEASQILPGIEWVLFGAAKSLITPVLQIQPHRGRRAEEAAQSDGKIFCDRFPAGDEGFYEGSGYIKPTGKFFRREIEWNHELFLQNISGHRYAELFGIPWDEKDGLGFGIDILGYICLAHCGLP